MSENTIVHGTALVIGNRGILLRGKPGAGKSDLVLRLIDYAGFGLGGEALKAELIADDQVCLTPHAGQIILSSPAILRGKLEIRGVGIVSIKFRETAPLHLLVDLMPQSEIPRMPEAHDLNAILLNQAFPRLMLDPLTPSACAKLRAMVSGLAKTA